MGSILKEKPFKLSLRIIKLFQHLSNEQRESLFYPSKYCVQAPPLGQISKKRFKVNLKRTFFTNLRLRIKKPLKHIIGCDFYATVKFWSQYLQNRFCAIVMKFKNYWFHQLKQRSENRVSYFLLFTSHLNTYE